MSLKNAIREAVDERAKQENSPLGNEAEAETSPSVALIPSDAEAPLPLPLETPSLTDTASHKAVNTASSKKPKGSSSLPPSAPIKAKATQQNAESEGAENPETAALTIRVPRQHRIHWLISAKKEGTSLTAAIAEALNARFGEPAE